MVIRGGRGWKGAREEGRRDDGGRDGGEGYIVV
jgi:hypothetical protein